MSSSKFRFPSKRISLDFLTTLGARGAAVHVEKLVTTPDLATWVVEAGIVDSVKGALQEQDIENARQLREAIYRAALARQQSTTPAKADIAIINGFAKDAPPTVVLANDGLTINRIVEKPSNVSAECLAAVARDAIEMLGSSQMERVHTCANLSCSALFLDLSRAGARRWCSMEKGGCGNRAKTTASRQRKKLQNLDL